MKPGKDRFANDPRKPPKLRSRVSFDNPVALANYEDLREVRRHNQILHYD